jgi:sugar/nucleoside kinase (ribokinase family)
MGVPIAFDLADPFVGSIRAELSEWSGPRVVLFANRDELSRMTGRVGEDEDIPWRPPTWPKPSS